VRDQEPEPLGPRRRVRGDLQSVGRGRGVADEDAVEAGFLVGAREAGDVLGVDERPLHRVDLRGVLGGDHAEELDGHRLRLLVVAQVVSPGISTSTSRLGRLTTIPSWVLRASSTTAGSEWGFSSRWG